MQQLSWTDTAFVRLESPGEPLHINPVLIYDPSTAPAPVTFTGLLAEIDARLTAAPALRRRLVGLPGGLTTPYWIEDSTFDLEFHIRHIALPKPGDWRQFCIQIARLHARPIDLSRPPWEMTVIEGLDNIAGLPPGCFAISLKVHHSMVDGVEGIAIINAMHSVSADDVRADSLPVDWQAESAPSMLNLLSRAVLGGAAHPVRAVRVVTPQAPGAVRFLGRTVRQRGVDMLPTPRTRFNGPVSQHRVFESRFYPFEEVRRIKKRVDGATVNDVALCLVGGAVRSYLLAHGALPDISLVCACPVSTRTVDAQGNGGNSLSVIRVALRTDLADPLERLAAISDTTSKNRVTRDAVGAPALLQVAELLPGALLGVGLRAAARLPQGGPVVANTIVTNVPSSRVPLYFAGARLVRSTGNGPIAAGIGLMHLVTTYVDDFTVAITGDRAMMPDPQFYGECLDQSFAEMASL